MADPFGADDEDGERTFERLYERHAGDVYRYALAVMRNPADAEDVTQTTFLNAYRALQQGERVHKPHNWLLRIAHNACRTRFIRARRRIKEVPLDWVADEIQVPEHERPNIRIVLEALGELPFNQRSALVMRELEGRTYEEIAEALDVTVPAVETLLFRARKRVRLRRSALEGFGAVQLPHTLETFVGGGAAATGGVLAGGAVLKVAAALVAGAVAGTAGYKAEAIAGPDAAAQGAAQLVLSPAAAAQQSSAGVPNAAAALVAGAERIRIGTKHGALLEGDDASVPGGSPGEAAGSPAAAPGGTSSASTPGSAPQSAVDTATAARDAVTSTAAGVIPSAPSVPVQTPSVPVQTPSAPVQTPTVPPPPPLPPVPSVPTVTTVPTLPDPPHLP